jgi:hypothetical protein
MGWCWRGNGGFGCWFMAATVRELLLRFQPLGAARVPIKVAVLLNGFGRDPQPAKCAIDSIEPKERSIRISQKVPIATVFGSIHETDQQRGRETIDQKDGDQTDIAARGDGSAFGQRNPPGSRMAI